MRILEEKNYMHLGAMTLAKKKEIKNVMVINKIILGKNFKISK